MSETTLEANVRQAKALFHGSWNRIKKGSLFRGLYRIEQATEGFFIDAGIVVPGAFENWKGTATVNAMDAVQKEYRTRLRTHTVGMDFNTMKRADAISKGGVQSALKAGAGMVLQDIESLMTALLETSESTTWLGSSNYHSATHGIPNSSITIDNLKSGAWTDSAAEVRSACWTGKAAFDSMRNANNYLYHDDSDQLKFVLFYNPAIEAYVQDALNPEKNAGTTTARPDKFIVPRSNPYLADADDMYLFVENPDFPAMQWGVEEEPNYQTNLANMSDTDRILHNQVLSQARHAGIEAFGHPAMCVKLKDA